MLLDAQQTMLTVNPPLRPFSLLSHPFSGKEGYQAHSSLLSTPPPRS